MVSIVSRSNCVKYRCVNQSPVLFMVAKVWNTMDIMIIWRAIKCDTLHLCGYGCMWVWFRLYDTCNQIPKIIPKYVIHNKHWWTVKFHITRQWPFTTFYVVSIHKDLLTHWGRDEIDAIFQTIFSNAFSLMKILEFRLKIHWNLFLRVLLTIF